MKKNYSNLNEALLAAKKYKELFGTVLYPYQRKNKWHLSSRNEEENHKLMMAKNKAIELNINNLKNFCITFFKRKKRYPSNENICEYFLISPTLLEAFLEDNSSHFSKKKI